MTNDKIVNIRGKQYMTVAGRVELAHEKLKSFDITTEIISHDPVVVKATVKTDKGTFTGISAANPTKLIEKQSPYEVAETSAVGRALGFAGYGLLEGIATADEVVKAEQSPVSDTSSAPATDKQLAMLKGLLARKGFTEADVCVKYDVMVVQDLSKFQASKAINGLLQLADVTNSPPAQT